MLEAQEKGGLEEDYSTRAADIARRIAVAAGKKEEECEEAYYAALLCSVLTQSVPELAGILAVAGAYDQMLSSQSFRDPLSHPAVREEFIMQAGMQFDPEYARIMVGIMDKDVKDRQSESENIEIELLCQEYRGTVSTGIPVKEEAVRIRFDCEERRSRKEDFCEPSIVLFDAYDRHVHDLETEIDIFRYIEYGEIWFDGRYVCTRARDIEAKANPLTGRTKQGHYEITAKRFKDHLAIGMAGPQGTWDFIAALQNNSKSAFIGITGENCYIKNIRVEKTGEKASAGDIPRITDPVSYIDRMESDIPNVQIDHTRSDATQGIRLEDELRFDFHTMTIPTASFVWCCPYVVLFYSEDQKVRGEGSTEYALIKINGELEEQDDAAENLFSMKKTDTFPGWDVWREKNKEGMECSIRLRRKGNRVRISTENLGIRIENTTILKDGQKEVFAALTGDQIALTDIRVKY